MTEFKKIKPWKIILIGNFMVNLPVTLAMLSVLSISLLIFGSEAMVPAILVSTYIGWALWAYLLEKWRLWGVANKIEPETMFRLGKYGFINFYRYRIIKDK